MIGWLVVHYLCCATGRAPGAALWAGRAGPHWAMARRATQAQAAADIAAKAEILVHAATVRR